MGLDVRSSYTLGGMEKLVGERARGGGLLYSFIYTARSQGEGDTKVNDIKHDSDTSTDLYRLRDPLLTYIKICADTFDNHEYIHFILYTAYSGREEMLKDYNYRMSGGRYRKVCVCVCVVGKSLQKTLVQPSEGTRRVSRMSLLIFLRARGAPQAGFHRREASKT